MFYGILCRIVHRWRKRQIEHKEFEGDTCIRIALTIYAIKIIKDIYEMHKNKYDHNILLNDIQKLDKIQHKHSLVAMRWYWHSMRTERRSSSEKISQEWTILWMEWNIWQKVIYRSLVES